MEIELIEEAYNAKIRIERNERIYQSLVRKVTKGEEYSPIEQPYQFGQDFGNLTIGDGRDFILDLRNSGCNNAIVQAIIRILDDKIHEDKEFIANL